MADFTSQYTGQQIEDRLSRVGTNATNIYNLQISKQDAISDLASIRSGAAAGATALQPGALSGKQDKLVSGVNIKTVDGQSLTGSGNVDLSRFVTSTVNNLANYYLKSEVYTKEEVQQLVYAATNGLSFVVAEALPTASNLTVNKIYLVPSTDPKTENVKDEWITIQVLGGYAWEKIGSATVDLSQYYTKSEVDALLANIDLSNYYTKAQVDALIANIDFSNYYTKSQIDTMFANIDLSDYYTKTQVDTALALKQDLLVSGTSIKTINNISLLGEGNISIADGVDGKSAYQLWLDEGNTGTIQDFFDSLQGNSGYSGDISELEIVNNLSDGGATAALSAQQGVVLDGKITALKNSIVFLTETEYENLVNPDPTKIYMTYES